MKTNSQSFRILTLVAVFLTVMFVYAIRLMKMQIVEGKDYAAMVQKGSSRTQTVKAARGEIVDRYGRPYAINRVGWDIVFDKAFLSKETQNQTILNVIHIMEEAGEQWIDNLPITKTEPFQFLEGYDNEIKKLKTFANVTAHSTVDDVMYWLTTDKFKIEGYSPIDARKIAGVRYEMELRGFSYSVPYTFAQDISINTAAKIKERGFELAGVDITESAIREYANADNIPHVIGRIGPIDADEYEGLKKKGYQLNDIVGKEGIEKAFEDQLRGTDGKRKIYLNSQGDVIDVVEETSPVPGNTVVLTIDQKLQQVARDALDAQIKWLQANATPGEGKEANAGSVVVIDVKTGEVLAMANYPYYNLSTYQQDFATLVQDNVNTPLFNRALFGEYSPGSIFKPVTAIAGLTSGVVDPTSTVLCNHKYTFYQDYQPGCLGWHGNINASDALRFSCNIYFYDVGRRVGIETLNKFARQLGLAEPTGIELPEKTGNLSSPEYSKQQGKPWNAADTIQSAIGQYDNRFTPLQLANYTATLANNGTRMKVNIVKSINSYTFDKTIMETSPVVATTVEAPPSVFATVREGMIKASTIGTAAAYFGNYPILVASKTGTPETREHPNSTFICYAPANDPQIAIAVVIEKGWHGYTGAPVAKKIFDAYFQTNENTTNLTPQGVILP